MDTQEILEMFKIDLKNIGKQINFDDYLENELDGAHNKKFVMLNNKDFENLTSPKSKKDKYITYIDNIRKEGLVPKNISVLKKSMWDEDLILNEILASRLMNYYNCPTVFNVPYLDNKNGEKYLVASVDCVSENETFENLYRVLAVFDDRVYTVWRRLEANLTSRFSNYPHFKEDFSQLEEDYFRSHLVREFAIGDADSGTHNFGLLLNEKDKRFKFVNFDYEIAFITTKRECADFNLEYMTREKPEIVRDVYNKSIVLRDALKSVNGEIDCSNEKIKKILSKIVNALLINLNEFISMYENLLQTQVK